MKLKEWCKDTIITKRINGKLITFNPMTETDYKWFYENGFEECFEVEKKVGNLPVIEFKNDVETPIKKKK